MIRISEALAKMRLSAEATVNDVNEVIRLFSVSTVEASRGNKARIGATIANPDIQRVEDFLRKRLALKMTVNARKIVEEAHVHGFNHENISRAICAMIMRGDLQELNQRKRLRRLR